jgi:hypothetical protein
MQENAKTENASKKITLTHFWSQYWHFTSNIGQK